MLWLIGILYVVICFLSQRLLLQRTEKRILHFLPLIAVGVIYLVSACLPLADDIMTALGRNDGYAFYHFAALLTAGVNTLGLLSIGAAWLYEKV